MVAIIEAISIIGAVLFGLLIAALPAAVYIVGRWREDKGGPPDRDLGFVTLFGLVGYLGFTMAVVGLQVTLTQLIGGRGGFMDVPIAVLISGLLVFVPTLLVLRRRAPSRATRLYMGLAVLASAIGLVFAITMSMLTLFSGGSRDFGTPIAALLVNLPVVIYGGLLLSRHATAHDQPA